MAAYEGGGGIGGKFRKRPFRRGPATPYDRPPAAARPSRPILAEPRGNGWLSRLVDPASRIIAWGASRLFSSSVLQKRLGVPPPAAPEANQKSMEEVLKEPSAVSLSSHEVHEQHLSAENIAVNNSIAVQRGTSSCVDGVFELEQLLKQKTFTRIEFDRLTQLLRSRTVEPSTPEVALDFENIEMANVPGQTNKKQQCAFDVSQPESSYDKKDKAIVLEHETRGLLSMHGNDATSAVRLADPKEEASSPKEIAKAYMSSRFLEVSPAARSMQHQLYEEGKTMSVGTPYAKKLSDHPVALRSAVRISGPVEGRSDNLMAPKLHGRSAMYKMSRSPYIKPCPMGNLGGDKSLVDGYGSPSMSSQSMTSNIARFGGRQMLKRRSSVLDDEIGSFGPTHRTRQRSIVMSPFTSSYSSVGRFLPSSSTLADQGSIAFNQKLLYLSEEKNDPTELQAADNDGVPVVPIPPQSTEMARKILQQLDKLVASPKEKSSKLKIDMDESSHILTHDMLHGRALKSMEEIDTSKFLNMQRNDSLETPNESNQQNLGNSIYQKQDKAEENVSAKPVVKAVQVTPTDDGLEKPSNISGRETKPSEITADFGVSFAATIPTQKRPSFQISAPEDLVELDDDSYDIKDSSSSAAIVDKKPELMSEHEITCIEDTNLEKSVESSSNGIHVSTKVSDRDSDKVPNKVVTENPNGFLFSATPALTNLSQLPSTPPFFTTSLEKSAPQNKDAPAPTFETGLEVQASGSPSTVAGSSGPKFGGSMTTTNILEGSKDIVGKTLKGDDLFNAFESSTPSRLSTSTSSGLSVFGASIACNLNNGVTSAPPTLTSSVCVAPAMTSENLFAPGFSTSKRLMPSSTTIISSPAPVFSTTSSFQFGTGGSLGASGADTSPTEKSVSANLVGESVEPSYLNVSSSATLGISPALSSTRNNNSALLTPSVFANMSSCSSALPAPLFSTATGSSAMSVSSASPTSSNGFSNFGASTQCGGANLFSSNNSHNLTSFGTTAGSPFSSPSAQSGTVSSSSTFGSSTPMTNFGLSGTSSSGSASTSFILSTPATKPLGSSSGFSFPTVTGSSSNSGSTSTFAPAITFGSSSGFSFSGTTTSSFSAGSSSSPVSTAPFGSSSFSSSTGANSSASSGGNISFIAGTGTALFSSTLQTSQPSVAGSIFSSATSSAATGFPFASASSSGSSPFTFGASSGSVFSFSSVGSTTSTISTSQPVFGLPNQIAGLNSGSPGNDQMNVEDSMADDPVQSSALPVATFGQPTNTPGSPNVMFSSPAAPGGTSTFQFGSQQNSFIPQSPSPFQSAGNLEFAAGGSFSLGSGGGDKSSRKIVRVRRDKHRKK